MQTNISIPNRLRKLPKRQTLRIGLGIAVMIALIFCLVADRRLGVKTKQLTEVVAVS